VRHRQIARFDLAFDSQIAAEVKDFDPPRRSVAQGNSAHRPFPQFACMRAGRLRDSGLDLDRVNRDEVGVFIGSGIGGLQTVSEQCTVLLERGPDRLSAFMIPMLISNMGSGLFSMYHKLRGPNFATCSACATSNHALGEAWRTIKTYDAQSFFAQEKARRLAFTERRLPHEFH
jgi:3-oxoacyl-[acyl-carrier-protein] synthase II